MRFVPLLAAALLGACASSPPDRHPVAAPASRPAVEIYGHRDGVTAAVFAPGGAFLLTGDASGEVQCRARDALRLLWRADAHRGAVLRAAVTGGGGVVATLGEDRQVVARDAADGKERWRWEFPPGKRALAAALAFSPDGRRLAVSGLGDSVHVLDAATGREEFAVLTEGSTALAWSADGRRIFAGSWSCEVAILDAEARVQVGNWVDPSAAAGACHGVLALAVSPDGRRLAEGDEDGVLRIWDADAGKPLESHPARGAGVLALAWTGERAVAVLYADGALAPAGPPRDALLGAGALAPLAERVALGTRDGRVRVAAGGE